MGGSGLHIRRGQPETGPGARTGALLGSLCPPPPVPDCSFLPQLQSLEQEKGRWRVEKAQLEQSVEENKERMEKLEGYWGEAQSLCQAVDEHLRETQAQYQALERKYSKAKRLIKDYQQKYVLRGLGAGSPGPGSTERPLVAAPPHPQLSREARSRSRRASWWRYLGPE